MAAATSEPIIMTWKLTFVLLSTTIYISVIGANNLEAPLFRIKPGKYSTNEMYFDSQFKTFFHSYCVPSFFMFHYLFSIWVATELKQVASAGGIRQICGYSKKDYRPFFIHSYPGGWRPTTICFHLKLMTGKSFGVRLIWRKYHRTGGSTDLSFCFDCAKPINATGWPTAFRSTVENALISSTRSLLALSANMQMSVTRSQWPFFLFENLC